MTFHTFVVFALMVCHFFAFFCHPGAHPGASNTHLAFAIWNRIALHHSAVVHGHEEASWDGTYVFSFFLMVCLMFWLMDPLEGFFCCFDILGHLLSCPFSCSGLFINNAELFTCHARLVTTYPENIIPSTKNPHDLRWKSFFLFVQVSLLGRYACKVTGWFPCFGGFLEDFKQRQAWKKGFLRVLPPTCKLETVIQMMKTFSRFL